MTSPPAAAPSAASLSSEPDPGADGLPTWYPRPTSPAVTKVTKANRKTATRPELAVRSALHAAGLRFRADLPIPVAGRRPVRVDIAFTAARLAVLVDGCFWHACPAHGTQPAANAGYWGPKLAGNVARDRAVDAALTTAGWTVIRVWEHEPPADAAARVADAYRLRRHPEPGKGHASRQRSTDRGETAGTGHADT